jgi:hypothetical protein
MPILVLTSTTGAEMVSNRSHRKRRDGLSKGANPKKGELLRRLFRSGRTPLDKVKNQLN